MTYFDVELARKKVEEYKIDNIRTYIEKRQIQDAKIMESKTGAISNNATKWPKIWDGRELVGRDPQAMGS